MSQPIPYLVGIDGGASKTVALLATHEGEIVGVGGAGSSNYQAVGIEAATAALNQALRAAFTDARHDFAIPAVICLGLAGVDRPADRALIERWIARTMPGSSAIIVNDAALIPAAGTPDGWGVGLICGTGAIAYGCSPDGATARADGWGNVMGDGGSGYAQGRGALRAVMAAFDGRGPKTLLTAAILDHWQLSSPTDLVQRIYVDKASHDEIALLAALVEEAVTTGDEVATELVRAAGRELANSVEAVANRLDLPRPTPIALAGGVLVKGIHTRRAMLKAGQERGLDLNPVQVVERPAEGALDLARRVWERG